MSKKHYVYWYHLKEHTRVATEGYVGVTVNLGIRHSSHTVHKLRYNSKLRNAFKKYGAENIIRTVIQVCTKEEAYALEEALRPEENIGWNITIGGGYPPDCTGLVHSEETRRKQSIGVSAALKGKPSPYKGITGRFSKKTRALIGSYHRGKTISDEHKQAITDKLSGANSPNAKVVHLVHKDNLSQVHSFNSITEASTALGINFSSLRSLYQDAQRKGLPAGRTWICLCEEHIGDPEAAIEKAQQQTRLLRSQGYKAKGKDNWKSHEITLENKQGKVVVYPSILCAAQAIGLSEATLRYHIAQTKKRKCDSNYTSVGWRVKYIEVQE